MKREFIPLLIMATFPVFLFAQTSRTDSLLEALKRDSLSYKVLLTLSEDLVDTDNMKSLLYAKKSKRIALEEGDTFKIVHSSRLVGQLYNRLDQIDRAIEELGFTLIIAERHKFRDEVKKILNSLAIAFNSKGEYDRALEHLLRSMKMKEEDQDVKGVSVSLHNIGTVYVKLNDYRLALNYSLRALELKQKIQDDYDLDGLYVNLGVCYTRLGDYEKAQMYFDSVFTICRSKCRPVIVLKAELGQGVLLLQEDKIKQAKFHFEKALALARAENNLECRLVSLVELSRIFMAEKNFEMVKTYLDEAASLPDKEQIIESMRDLSKLSSDYYRAVGNFRLASEFDRTYSQLVEKVNDSELRGRLVELQVRFVEQENRQKLQTQQVLLEAQGKSIQKQGTINALLGGIAILTVSLLIVYYRLNIKKDQINKRLDHLVKERTTELEQNRLQLQHAYDEQTIVLDKVARNLGETLATIKGLSTVAVLEHRSDVPEYLKITEDKLVQLVESTRRLSAVSTYQTRISNVL